MRSFFKTILIIITILLTNISCKAQIEDHSELVLINKVLDTKLNDAFYRQNLDSLYPKLLNPKTFNPIKDSVKVKKIQNFQNAISESISAAKIKWNVSKTNITIFTRVYFDSSGKIEYFAFKIDNDSIQIEPTKELAKVLKKSLTQLNLGINHSSKYNHCSNYEIINH
ncbi:hypothetical protein NO995_07230 [Aestuariibaculum sp. M13]|uniref:hypothetical protein n=1 Tax=Aestuariibaculum sp. M13 TaxID=2967132 RepID=UPI002159CC44|nr:hypothetical protein [Aestuariibaculum sp. M13]MCR8667466.1 hypothetical protein [Aestuariibaculum sp. M13]